MTELGLGHKSKTIKRQKICENNELKLENAKIDKNFSVHTAYAAYPPVFFVWMWIFRCSRLKLWRNLRLDHTWKSLTCHKKYAKELENRYAIIFANFVQWI